MEKNKHCNNESLHAEIEQGTVQLFMIGFRFYLRLFLATENSNKEIGLRHCHSNPEYAKVGESGWRRIWHSAETTPSVLLTVINGATEMWIRLRQWQSIIWRGPTLIKECPNMASGNKNIAT